LPWYSPLYQRRPDTLPRQVKWFPGLAAVGVVAEPNTRPDVALDTDGAPIADRSVYRREARQTVDGLYGNTYTITALGNGIHTLTWRQKPGTFAIGNSTFIVGDHDVIVVDTGFSRSTGRAILEGLKTVTDKPVSMVINTHWHADHVFGNQVFRSAFPAARFVAHPATREGIITGEVEFRDANRPKRLARIDELKAKATRTDAETRELREAEMQIEAWQGDYVLPDLLVDQKLTIMQGKRLVHILHLGDANTKGDLVIHLPAERVAISGDMAITPMQFAFFSSPRKWIETLGRLAAIDAVTIVPGHGPPQTDRRFIADLQAMLRSVVEQVDAGIKAGQDLEALKAGVKVVPPAGSIYGKASNAALDTLFRIPAIESAFKEKG
jgi:glyoxylase-like metal-dependent hydrolase (beta-lactamase superfamily II)